MKLVGCAIVGLGALYVYLGGISDSEAASVLTGAVAFYAVIATLVLAR